MSDTSPAGSHPEAHAAIVDNGTAPVTPLQPGPAARAFRRPGEDKPAGLWSDAWYDLRHNPVFVIGSILVALLVVISVFPGFFDTVGVDAKTCSLSSARKGISAEHWFGTDNLGCDTYSRVIWGTRVSVTVGIVSAMVTALVGGTLGLLAGFYGRWVDVLLSRVAEIVFAVPSVLGALLILSVVGRDNAGIGTVVSALSALAWPLVLRIMRAAVLTAKSQDYVMAARALGAGPVRIMSRHILPNAVAPVIVVSTMNLAVFIAAEAALSFLGVGIQSPQISWGLMIADARNRFLEAPLPLLFPALFLSLTILGVVMLGDAVRDALDPKLR